MTKFIELKVTAELIVASASLTPEEVSKCVQVECDRSWKTGDPRGKTGKSWATHGWVLRSIKSAEQGDDAVNSLVSSCVGDLIQRLKPIAAKVRDLSREGDVGVSIDILASHVPALNFDHEVLKVIADAGAWLQIDLILWNPPDEEDLTAQRRAAVSIPIV